MLRHCTGLWLTTHSCQLDIKMWDVFDNSVASHQNALYDYPTCGLLCAARKWQRQDSCDGDAWRSQSTLMPITVVLPLPLAPSTKATSAVNCTVTPSLRKQFCS